MSEVLQSQNWKPINAQELEFIRPVVLQQPILNFSTVKLMINLEGCGETYIDFLAKIDVLIKSVHLLSPVIEHELSESGELQSPLDETIGVFQDPIITFTPEEGEEVINWSFSFKASEDCYLYLEFADNEFQEVWGGD